MSQPPTPGQYRQALDTMLEDFRSRGSFEVHARQQRVARIVIGWVAHVHELATVVRDLVDSSRGHASLYLSRSMLEHTVMAHWVRLTGDKGVDAVLGLHRQSTQTLQEDAKGGPFALPADFVDALAQVGPLDVSEQTIARRFNKVCDDLGLRNQLYAGYRMASQCLHPGFLVASLYATPDGKALRQSSALNNHAGDIAMAAHCLVWAGRTVDELTPGKPRKKGLQSIARELQIRPMLPRRRQGVITL